jgi:hypothetical protein
MVAVTIRNAARGTMTRALGRCIVMVVALAGCRDAAEPNLPGGGSSGGAPNSATIGPAGGSVHATLAGGASMTVTIPAGALADPVRLTLGPRVAGAAVRGAFSLEPAGQRLAHPARLDIQVADGALSSTSVVAFEQGSLVIPVSSTGAGTSAISVTLDVLGVPGQATVGGAALVVSRASGGPANGGIVSMPQSQRAQAAAAVLAELQRLGTVDAAQAMQLVMDAFIDFDPPGARADAAFPTLVTGWRNAVCGDFDFALSAMHSFGFSSDYVGLERVMGNVVGWVRAILDMSATLATVEQAGCPNGIPDAEATVNDKLAAMLPAITTDLGSFALVPAPQDSLFLQDRLRPLLDLASSFAVVGYIDAMTTVTGLVTSQTVRLRDAGYAACRARSPQSLQARLMQLENLQGAFTAASPYDEADLESDIELCGMAIQWSLASGRGLLGGGDAPDTPELVGVARLAGDDSLHLSGNLNALRCPPSVSANAEQLEIRAGRTASALTRIAVLTPSNNNTYLEAAPLNVSTAAIRQAAGLGAADTGTAQVVLSRIGGTCGTQFVNLAHSPLGAIAVRFNGPSLTGSWEGTITTFGRSAPIVVNIAHEDTTVRGFYIVLVNLAGPSGGFEARFDGRALLDVQMPADTFCIGCGMSAASLSASPAGISGTLATLRPEDEGTIQLTRRAATRVGGPLNAVWSGPMEVSGRGVGIVVVRFIQADDHVDGTWGAAGFGLGHFSGTLDGATFTFTGSDDAPECTLTTSGTMRIVAADSITFTGNGTNCNGGFPSSGFVKHGLVCFNFPQLCGLTAVKR